MMEFSQILWVTFWCVKPPSNILYSFQKVINKAREEVSGRKTEFTILYCLNFDAVLHKPRYGYIRPCVAFAIWKDGVFLP